MRRRFGIGFWLAFGWIGLLVFLALFADLLPLRDPEALGVRTQEVARFESPGPNAWFGGDAQGRDLFSRVIYGIRPALILGVTATFFAALVGMIVGIAAGYFRGATDRVVSGVIDLALAFPALVLLIAVRATFGNSITVLVVIFAVLGIPAYARIVRATSMSCAEREFVDAARSMGASDSRIVFKELLPIIVRPVLSYAVIGFAIVLVAEGGLAFIGLSLDEVTWGRLIADGQAEIRNHPFLSLIPATVMFVTILAFNVVGDALRLLGSPRQVATDRKMEVIGQRVGDTDTGIDRPAVAGGRSPTILQVRDLHTYLDTPFGQIEAVAGVALTLRRGEALGVVGESGSGKTMLLRSIVGTFPLASVARSGTVDVEGTDMLRASDREVRKVLGTTVGMVSQNPLNALNPVRRIGTQLVEPMMLHRGLSRSEARAKSLDLLKRVGIPAADRRIDEYPHQLSGGMRQRVTIAIALANDPDLLLADEPTTALDVTVQDQILRLLAGIQAERDMAMVLVTHDLAVVRGFTDRVAVMYGGQVVETGTTEEIFTRPRHHYTQALLDSIPDLTKPSHSELTAIAGSPPSLLFPPEGCRYAPRCSAAQDDCFASPPMLEASTVNGEQPHAVRCWHPVTIGSRQERAGV